MRSLDEYLREVEDYLRNIHFVIRSPGGEDWRARLQRETIDRRQSLEMPSEPRPEWPINNALVEMTAMASDVREVRVFEADTLHGAAAAFNDWRRNAAKDVIVSHVKGLTWQGPSDRWNSSQVTYFAIVALCEVAQ